MLKTSVLRLAPAFAANPLANRLFGGLRRHKVPVFMLHRMSDPALGVHGHCPSFLRTALAWLQDNGFTFISIEDLARAILEETTVPEKAVCFTCDDGFYDQLDIAAPIFAEFNCPATIFLLTNFLDGLSWPWDYQVKYIIEKSELDSIPDNEFDIPRLEISNQHKKQHTIDALRALFKQKHVKEAEKLTHQLANLLNIPLSNEPPKEYTPLTWEGARQFEAQGICFGPHSQSHAIFSQIDNETARQEITNSFQRLKDELSKPSPIFCFPTGRKDEDFTSRDMQLVQEEGFLAALSTDPGYVNSNMSKSSRELFSLRRFSFPSNLEQLSQYASWIECVKEKLRN